MKFSFRTFFVVLFTLAFFIKINSIAQGVYHEEFPILAWNGPDLNKTGLSAFKQMKEAGFTMCYSPFQDLHSNLRLLHIADSLKFGVLLTDHRIDSLVTSVEPIINKIDNIIADYQTNSSLRGYFLYDKPGYPDFEKLGLIKKYIQGRDPTHPVFINLLPIYATPLQLGLSNYFEYVWEFIDKVNPDFISFEHFPITHSGVRTDYYKNLEIIRKASLDKGIPFWVTVLTVPFQFYPSPEQSHLRVQIYSALAYGAKGLVYYSFITPDSQMWNYGNALLDRGGNPTLTYQYALTINKEVHQLAPTLFRLESIGVYHSEPVPAGCSPAVPDLPITKIEGKSVLIGLFKHKNEKYIMLVNKNYLFGAKPRIYFSNKVKKIEEITKDKFQPLVVNFNSVIKEKSCTILFKAGDGRLFRIYD